MRLILRGSMNNPKKLVCVGVHTHITPLATRGCSRGHDIHRPCPLRAFPPLTSASISLRPYHCSRNVHTHLIVSPHHLFTSSTRRGGDNFDNNILIMIKQIVCAYAHHRVTSSPCQLVEEGPRQIPMIKILMTKQVYCVHTHIAPLATRSCSSSRGQVAHVQSHPAHFVQRLQKVRLHAGKLQGQIMCGCLRGYMCVVVSPR